MRVQPYRRSSWTPAKSRLRRSWPGDGSPAGRGAGSCRVNGLRPKEPVKRGRGRPEVPVADNVFAAVYKVYCGWSARRFMYDLGEAFKAGHLSRSMSHNSVLRALESEELTPVLKDLVGQS